MRLLISSFLLSFSTQLFALSGEEYLQRFMTYRDWSEHLPSTSSPDPNFLSFIDNPAPLSKKLREKWLYQLARQGDWKTYNTYYQPSTDLNLQCYAQMALYQLGQNPQAMLGAQPLWLNGHFQPKPCEDLFSVLLKNHAIDENLITKRLTLALETSNLPLAYYLLKQFNPPQLNEITLLESIQKNPSRIKQLKPSTLHSEFYLYGLKRMISGHMDEAITLWKQPSTKTILTHAQQQAFLSRVALYKAMRNHPDSSSWFAKIDPEFYTDNLIDWQLRFALKYKQWHRVAQLIQDSHTKDSPCWQYWLARALEEQGQTLQAANIYQVLSSKRNYYGFLASQKLNKTFNFEHEPTPENSFLLAPYQPFLDKIKLLYNSHQQLQASRLLNDFVMELPREDLSALCYWLVNELRWYGKSVYLSNNEALNNQISLRFPIAYRDVISTQAKLNQIPEALIYAIIRQESTFRDDIVSGAGAEGLMQLMPATAQVVAKQNKILYTNKQQLFIPSLNIQLGTGYLHQLSKRYNNHPLLMAAAYNAGPKQVNFWLKNHPPKEIDIWIETLPWQETRNYLQNIVAFYAVYQYRLQKKSDLEALMSRF